MPTELVEDGFQTLAEDGSFSPKMRDKFQDGPGEAALWRPWVVTSENRTSIDGRRPRWTGLVDSETCARPSVLDQN